MKNNLIIRAIEECIVKIMEFRKISEFYRQTSVNRIFLGTIKNVYELFTNFLMENYIYLYGSSLLGALCNKYFENSDIDLVCEYLGPAELKLVCEELAHIICCEHEIETYGINIDYSNKKEKNKKTNCKPRINKKFISNDIFCIVTFSLKDLVQDIHVYKYDIELVILKKGISFKNYILKSDFSILRNYFDGIDIFVCENIKNIENMISTYILESADNSIYISNENQYRLKKYLQREIVLLEICYKKTNEIYHCHNEICKINKNIKNLCIFLKEENLYKIIENYEGLESLIIYKNNSALIIDNLPCTLKKINIHILENNFFKCHYWDYYYRYGTLREDDSEKGKKISCEIKIKLPFGCVYLLNDEHNENI